MSFVKWSITIVLCALVFGGLAAYKVMDIRASIAAAEAYPEQSETVEVASVATAIYEPTINVLGEIVAVQRLDLRNEIEGEITAVNFESGAWVEPEQVLVQLDIANEQANLLAARARAELARVLYERSLKLADTGVAAQEQLDRAKADLGTAQAEITVLERTIDKKTLRSPFRARAGLHNFEVGQILPADTLITSLVGDTDNLWVDFQLPQFYSPLAIGSQVGMTQIGADEAQPAVTATLIAENTVLNPDNRSRAYRAVIANDTRKYVPQTMVKIAAPIGEARQLLQVPVMAIQNDPLGQYVFVLQEDPSGKGFRARRQQVRVSTIGSTFALLEPDTGLQEGDRIAAAGAFKLYEGILVFAGQRAVSAASGGMVESGQY